ncbi:sigma 54-interacting transcriptional regulator [Aneurinibacillus sp. Ricciae_BoGa-3]|uniref:sigma-54 interaction domain-containing protein n=1 Tax=Aneurinibacillus sp. Ricciae_BoGa-3 TaxID=3022697 RepID=UPI00233FD848|nr:sigma 54-interacting transcriptional regulator [Aneurinibacillus sp. Ricciae_BoGa-3]WCK56043.1 sigma 54-interacting transcriptional regulator [Aneurinibacillus sp. Ricciae_BoGa-3]
MKLQNHFLDILESIHDAVLVVSKDTTVAFVNKAYSRHFGIPAPKIIGRKLSEIEPKARILQVLQNGKELINDYSYVHSLKKDVCANITPLIEKEQLIGAVAIMRGISEVVHLQEELNRYKRYSHQLEKRLHRKSFSLLESQSTRMKIAVDLARKVAAVDATVLLQGDTGVGKEVFAKAIHEASMRVHRPFIPINMSSIPESLFESELFGYEEGSFSGSKKGGKKGLFELSNGGTLFLDEIGEMPLNLQAKILRVIQERAFQKVGGTQWHPLDVRIICATNRDLRTLIKQGIFREDLYYRLNVVPIHIPPLRERKVDIAYLVNTIMAEICARYRKHVTITPEVLNAFVEYDWPGNVRELSNVLERMIAVSIKTYLSSDDIPEYLRNTEVQTEAAESPLGNYSKSTHSLNGLLEKTERDRIKEVLCSSKNRTEAILKLGISRKTFYAKLQKYGLL